MYSDSIRPESGGIISETIKLEGVFLEGHAYTVSVQSRQMHDETHFSIAHGNSDEPDDTFQGGVYNAKATTSEGMDTVKAQPKAFSITDVDVTDQYGAPSELTAGEMRFVKINLQSGDPITSLITVNIFDSEFSSIGISSLRTTFSSGNSEIIMSVMIPEHSSTGPAEIYVNAFTDWPSNGGIPQTSEKVSIKNIQ